MGVCSAKRKKHLMEDIQNFLALRKRQFGVVEVVRVDCDDDTNLFSLWNVYSHSIGAAAEHKIFLRQCVKQFLALTDFSLISILHDRWNWKTAENQHEVVKNVLVGIRISSY